MFLALEREDRLKTKYPGLLALLDAEHADTLGKITLIGASWFRENQYPPSVFADELSAIAAVQLWKSNRTIYQVDPELTQALICQAKSTGDDEQLPVELLKNLPQRCIAVEASAMCFSATDRRTERKAFELKTSGRFFIFVDRAMESPSKTALYTVWEIDGYGDELPMIPVELEEGDTLGNMQKKLAGFSAKNGQRINRAMAKFDFALPSFAMQVVLYLQAQNAEMRARPSGAKKSRQQKKSSAKPVRAPKVYDVGVRYGSAIRKSVRYVSNISDHSADHTAPKRSPRPHMRRGHFHGFWTGPRGDSENRKLIIKWIAPTPVGGKQDGVTTVRKIIKEKNT